MRWGLTIIACEKRLNLTFSKLIYPRLEDAQDEFVNELPVAIWSDYNLVHNKMWHKKVTITQECLIRNLINPYKDQVWVEIDGEVQLVSAFDLEIG